MVPAEPIVLHFTFKANSQLEHLIIRTNLVGPQKFELSGLHCIYTYMYGNIIINTKAHWSCWKNYTVGSAWL